MCCHQAVAVTKPDDECCHNYQPRPMPFSLKRFQGGLGDGYIAGCQAQQHLSSMGILLVTALQLRDMHRTPLVEEAAGSKRFNARYATGYGVAHTQLRNRQHDCRSSSEERRYSRHPHWALHIIHFLRFPTLHAIVTVFTLQSFKLSGLYLRL